jgi:hypothetical protein
MSAPEAGWVGDRPSLLQASATLYGGVAGVMVLGVQPLVLGALVDEGRIALDELGRIATVETLGIALGASAGAILLRRLGARSLGVLAAVAVAAGNFAMPLARGALAIAALRGGVGLAEGVLVALAVAMIARAPAPERWSGVFLGVQTVAQAVGAWLLPILLVPRLGRGAGFQMMGAMALVACATAPLGSREGGAAAGADELLPRLTPGAWLGLGWVFASLAATFAVWSYFDRIGAASRISEEVIGEAAALSLITQAAGSFLATGVGARIGWRSAVLLCALGQLGSIAAFAWLGTPAPFVAAGALFGFAWLFGMPYQVRALVEIDPSREAAKWIAPAQIFGGATGPWLASLFVRGADLGGALELGALATIASVGLMFVAARAIRSPVAASGA